MVQAKLSHYYRALYEVAEAINSSLETNVVLNQIVEGAAKAMEAKGCSLLLLTPDRKLLLHTAAYGLSDWYVRKGPVSVDISMADALNGKPVAVLNAPNDPRIQYREQARKEGIASILCVPVRLKEEVVGAMRLYTSEPRHFSDEDIFFLSAVANLGAIALENAELYEAMKTSEALRKRLFAITSHDLREPLVTVHSYLKAILDGFAGEIGAQQREMLQKTERRMGQLLELHSAILDARSFDAEEVIRERELIWPKELVEHSAESVRASAREKAVTLKMEMPSELSPIYASAKHLHRVLVNLLSNAIKFTPAGGEITVKLEDKEELTQVDVIDTGIGIPPGDLPHIFEEFYRGGDAPAKGLGLGLSVAKNIIEAHGGTIWTESPCGLPGCDRGTRVSFTLPRKKGGPK